ncbi:hypothetical protein [Desulfobotulus alkaliphilus]|uniref:hypothetical protein n=1 Tax=Desulfobotulus alkaliphilus TaxID=622671 RepID=UPI001647885C|nr:hypothetical protein [Desulfobotulus alkaliphilus]
MPALVLGNHGGLPLQKTHFRFRIGGLWKQVALFFVGAPFTGARRQALKFLWLKDSGNPKYWAAAFLGMEQRAKLLNIWHEFCSILYVTKGRLRKTKEKERAFGKKDTLSIIIYKVLSVASVFLWKNTVRKTGRFLEKDLFRFPYLRVPRIQKEKICNEYPDFCAGPERTGCPYRSFAGHC